MILARNIYFYRELCCALHSQAQDALLQSSQPAVLQTECLLCKPWLVRTSPSQQEMKKAYYLLFIARCVSSTTDSYAVVLEWWHQKASRLQYSGNWMRSLMDPKTQGNLFFYSGQGRMLFVCQDIQILRLTFLRMVLCCNEFSFTDSVEK